MSYDCPRCLEPIGRVPEGCADPKCPKGEIDEIYEQAFVSYKKEAARDAVIAAARLVDQTCDATLKSFCEALGAMRAAVAALDAAEGK